MAKKKVKTEGPSKSDSIREVLKANPKMKAKEAVSALAEKGIQVTEGLVYGVRGYMKGKKGRKKKTRQMVARVEATGRRSPGRLEFSSSSSWR